MYHMGKGKCDDVRKSVSLHSLSPHEQVGLQSNAQQLQQVYKCLHSVK